MPSRSPWGWGTLAYSSLPIPHSLEASVLEGKEPAMVKAYVLIVTNPGKTKHVLAGLKKLDHIVELHEVMGPYDIVVEVEVDQLSDIPKVLGEGIRPIDGIESTTSLVTFPE
jgi:DNA-binding Lrp family transcriptional regulator